MSIGNHSTQAPRMGATPELATALNIPEERPEKGVGFMIALAFAQFGLFLALLGPVMVSLALKVNTIVDTPTEVTSALGGVLGFGAIAALIGNALFGRLSDLTISRFGRRRPWMIGGSIVLLIALLIMALATNTFVLGIGWFIAQLGANAAFAPYIATLSDQLPPKQYARASAIVGIMQNVGVLAAMYLAAMLTENMLMLFLVPGVIAFIGFVIYSLVIDDAPTTSRPHPINIVSIIRSFWVNPIKHKDFGLAWWSRFCIILASFLFTTFRLPYLMDRLNLDTKAATGAIATGVLVYTITLVIAGYVAGAISDKTGKRKMLVIASAAIFAVGTYLLMHVSTIGQFYAVEALIGAGYGIYMAIDMALVLQVIPNPEDAGRDLGVFNMANALPQSFAPILGGVLLAVTPNPSDPNFGLLFIVAAIVALAGALFIIPIRKAQ